MAEVTLLVGHRKYIFAVRTLGKVKDSMLARCCAPPWSEREKHRVLDFSDRDPIAFWIIQEFLENVNEDGETSGHLDGIVSRLPRDLAEEAWKEADFFLLRSLQDLIDATRRTHS